MNAEEHNEKNKKRLYAYRTLDRYCDHRYLGIRGACQFEQRANKSAGC